jgi:E3 ubiquitin-protein ligase TRIP12
MCSCMRCIRFRNITGKESTDANDVFGMPHRLVEHIADLNASEKEVGNALKELVTCLSAHTSD